MKDITKLSLGLSLLAIILSIYGLISWEGSPVKEFTAEDFDRYAEGYQERQIAKQEEVKNEAAKDVEIISANDHVKGDREAEITIFEYSDFECPYCKRFYKRPGEVVKKYSGKVNAVFRHFPLSFHDPLATKQANAAECASEQGGSEMFYKYHDQIFSRTKSNGQGMNESELTKIASDLGLNLTKFESCLNSEKYIAKIKNDIETGTNAGVTGTPGVIVKNNKTGEVKVLAGAVPVEIIEAAVEELLNK